MSDAVVESSTGHGTNPLRSHYELPERFRTGFVTIGGGASKYLSKYGIQVEEHTNRPALATEPMIFGGFINPLLYDSQVFGAAPSGIRDFVSSSVSSILKGLRADVFLSLRTQQKSLKNLQNDWDGYGADAIPSSRIDSLIDELMTVLVEYSGPLPEIVPGSDGSVQVEWHRNNVEIYYGIDAHDKRFVYVNTPNSEPVVSSGSEARAEFISTLARYFPREESSASYATTKRATWLVR